ncbi:MAG: undecaprenyl-diphosphate phosphatase [Clostridiales bacterium]|nr:undecaprenyl-diphosphate phosphatase [Clostridiales bacterium]
MIIAEYIKSIILGIVEGITEWLPISSTGHLIIVNELMKAPGSFTVTEDFFPMYLYVIQLGAILAVCTLFFRKLNPFSPKKSREEKTDTWRMWFKVLVGVIPAGVIGLLLNDLMDAVETWQVVSAMLIIYGIAFIVVERLPLKTNIADINGMSYKTAFIIGLFQVLSIVPGTSRSGSTILGGRIAGCERAVAAEFSFFLAIPIMFGTTFIKLLKYDGMITSNQWGILITGFLVSYLVSLPIIRFLMSFVKKHSFTAFGWYRILVGIVVIAFFTLTGF